MDARADGAGARERWKWIGRVGASMGVWTCVDGVGCKGKGGNGQGEGREREETGGEKEGLARASVDGRACADGVEVLL